uniref:Uncharacterized protein n=1 Tax=Eptatretus burgeri TaxID=7764 RepID=A0A8C4NC07_EPTBU
MAALTLQPWSSNSVALQSCLWALIASFPAAVIGHVVADYPSQILVEALGALSGLSSPVTAAASGYLAMSTERLLHGLSHSTAPMNVFDLLLSMLMLAFFVNSILTLIMLFLCANHKKNILLFSLRQQQPDASPYSHAHSPPTQTKTRGPQDHSQRADLPTMVLARGEPGSTTPLCKGSPVPTTPLSHHPMLVFQHETLESGSESSLPGCSDMPTVPMSVPSQQHYPLPTPTTIHKASALHRHAVLVPMLQGSEPESPLSTQGHKVSQRGRQQGKLSPSTPKSPDSQTPLFTESLQSSDSMDITHQSKCTSTGSGTSPALRHKSYSVLPFGNGKRMPSPKSRVKGKQAPSLVPFVPLPSPVYPKHVLSPTITKPVLFRSTAPRSLNRSQNLSQPSSPFSTDERSTEFFPTTSRSQSPISQVRHCCVENNYTLVSFAFTTIF